MMEFPLIIYDGDCGLCNRSISFIIRHEKSEYLRFSPVGSAFAQKVMRANGLSPDDIDSIVLVESGNCHVESDAVVGVAKFLKWPWSMIAWSKAIPRPFRDWCYRLVAANRMKLGSADKVCDIADERIRRRIIES